MKTLTNYLNMLSLAGRVTVVGELWGRRRVIPGLSPSPKPNTVQCSTLWSLVCVRRLWLTITNQGHNWFGDEWPSLGLTEEEFLIEYSKTLDKLADTHKRYKNQQDSHVLHKFSIIQSWPVMIFQRHGYSAAVFTQTTDVEGEINGFFTYDRQVL